MWAFHHCQTMFKNHNFSVISDDTKNEKFPYSIWQNPCFFFFFFLEIPIFQIGGQRNPTNKKSLALLLINISQIVKQRQLKSYLHLKQK